MDTHANTSLIIGSTLPFPQCECMRPDGGCESIDNCSLNPPLPTVQMHGGGDGGCESIDNDNLNPPLPTVQMHVGGMMVVVNPSIILDSTVLFPPCKCMGEVLVDWNPSIIIS